MTFKKIYLNLMLMLSIGSTLYSQTVEIPAIQYVTVNRASQQTQICWTMVQPANVDGYIVKRQIFNQTGVVNGSYNTVATINNKNQMCYIDNGPDYGYATPGLRPETYRIVAYKLIGATIEYSNMSSALSTIYLSPINFNLCHEQNTLTWTSYKGLVNNTGVYRVYYSNTPAGPPVLLAEVPLSDTSYVHQHVAANTQYYYYIEAYSSTSNSSSSNVQSITTTMPPVPTVMNADYGTIEMYNQITLSFTLDQAAQVSSYKLLKSKSLNGPWDTIASYPKGAAKLNTTDPIQSNQETVYYKVVAFNTCGIESRQSNLAQNIVLEAYPDATLKYTNKLSWLPYQTWLGGVEGYKVYRSIDGAAFVEISQVGSTINTYSDDVQQFVQPEINGQQSKGQFCYYVEATEAAGNPYGVVGVSKSNISCAQQEAVVFVPNAFNPNSPNDENRTFKPVMSFVNDYSLIIYNRWGDIVFQSSDPLNGWDGRKNGELQPKATYIYFLKYRTKDNKLVEKSGQVNLVY